MILKADAYEYFAKIYDSMMVHVPYSRWADYLYQRAKLYYGKRPESVLDLGCGTGKLLAEMGKYVESLSGLDRSQAMLDRAEKSQPAVQFVKGDIQGPLPYEENSQAWIVSTHDTVNYLIDDTRLMNHFSEVSRILVPGGIYSFDIVTEQHILNNYDGDDCVFNVEDMSLTWANSFQRETSLLTTRLTFERNDDPVYQEVHQQRHIEDEEIINIAGVYGMTLVALESDYSSAKPSEYSTVKNLHMKKDSA